MTSQRRIFLKRNNPFITLKQFSNVSNPSSMHGLYPYRGKISALDAQFIINQLPMKGTLLDPFCGSGTIVYEAQKHGLKSFGVDSNPLAVQIAKAKTYTGSIDVITEGKRIIAMSKEDLASHNYEAMSEEPLKSFHHDTADEIMTVKNYFNEMNEYLQGAFYGSIALAARGCNNYKWTSTTVGKNIEPKTYINFYDKFLKKIRKHSKYLIDQTFEDSVIIQADSRKLSDFIEPNSIDYVFTSPPYFDGLDYTSYYGKLIYEIFKVDREEIKHQLIQHIKSYEDDMRIILKELDIVTKDDSLIIFVVGDKKIKGNIINGGEYFNKIKKASYILERSYSKSSSQLFDTLNNTSRKEQIVIWDKQNGELQQYGY